MQIYLIDPICGMSKKYYPFSSYQASHQLVYRFFFLPTFSYQKYQEYLSCYWPDFDEILKVDSWENLEQISTVMVTFVLVKVVLATTKANFL